jgi:hypothetical protein
MPKSRKRGGEKAHRKRITARNNNFKKMWNRLQKQAWEKHEEWKKNKEQEKTEWNPDQYYPGDETPSNERLLNG